MTGDGFKGGGAPRSDPDMRGLFDLAKLDRNAVTRQFLRSLDDPARFMGAHLALSLIHRTTRGASSRKEGHNVVLWYEGLDAVVPASKLVSHRGGHHGDLRMVGMMGERGLDSTVVRIDPAQLPR